MTIRIKLIIAFVQMLLLLIGMGAVSIWAVVRWQSAAERVQVINEQRERGEILRTLMFRQIVTGLDIISRAEKSDESFFKAQELASKQLMALKANRLAEREEDHIQALEEAYRELEWIGASVFHRLTRSTPADSLMIAHARLREISDEVTAGVTALHQFHQAEVGRSIAAANAAGRMAYIVFFAAVLIATIQLGTVIYFSNRWVVGPLGAILQTTRVLGSGDLLARTEVQSKDELGEVAAALNTMAQSLKEMQQIVLDRERFAALGEVVAYTAHNLRNPLAGIRAAAQVMMQSTPGGDTETRSSLADIMSAADRMDVWMRGLLHLASPTQLHLETVAVRELLTEVLDAVGPSCETDGVSLTIEIDNRVDAINVDPSLIQQALVALITNAKEAGARHIELNATLEVGTDGKSLLRLGIADDGKGISAEMMPKLFRAFATDKPGGTGLGLAQVKKFVELHRGVITLDSLPGKGTTVAIQLPMA